MILSREGIDALEWERLLQKLKHLEQVFEQIIKTTSRAL